MFMLEFQRFSFHHSLFIVSVICDSLSQPGNNLQDYVGDDVNVNNFFAVLLGNRTALTGGSGKVVDSGPNDHIFIFYSDHGGPGVLG